MKAGEQSSKEAKILISKSEEDYQKKHLPIYKAFGAVGNFFMARHSLNPLNKMLYFKKGRKYLDEAVQEDYQNVEIRLIRYLSQQKIPKILDYRQNMEEDKALILKNYKKSNDHELVEFIKTYFKL